jgi:electron transfer flavoprotein beta subunit
VYVKILVAVKRVIDYRVKVRLKADKSGVETQSVKQSMNPFDEIALEEALRLQEAGSATEVVVVTCGAKQAQDVLRTALAMGANRAIHIESTDELSPATVAAALAEVAKKESVDLVLLGKQAIDNDCNQVGQMMAGYLAWPQATFASNIDFNDGAKRLTVTRETDNGLETIDIALPAVVTADLRLNTPRFVSLPNIMKAKAKQIEALSLQDLGVEASSLIRCVGYDKPAQRQAGKMVGSLQEIINTVKEQVNG